MNNGWTQAQILSTPSSYLKTHVWLFSVYNRFVLDNSRVLTYVTLCTLLCPCNCLLRTSAEYMYMTAVSLSSHCTWLSVYACHSLTRSSLESIARLPLRSFRQTSTCSGLWSRCFGCLSDVSVLCSDVTPPALLLTACTVRRGIRVLSATTLFSVLVYRGLTSCFLDSSMCFCRIEEII